MSSGLSAGELNAIYQDLLRLFPVTLGYYDTQGNLVGVINTPLQDLPDGAPILFGGLNNFRNVLDGGDFTVNPWQRNIPALGNTTVGTVVITGTSGQFSCAASNLVVGAALTISGTLGGTGTISGYVNPTTYYIIATNGTTTFQLSATPNGAPITTTTGTPTGLTYIQSGVIATAITNTLTYFADRWFAVGGSSSSSITLSQIADFSIVGFSQSHKWQRTVGNTNITVGTVAITGTAGQFSCAASTLFVGQSLNISGTYGGTGSITGYVNPTTYYIIATNGTTTFQLSATPGGAPITTTAGTPTGLTYLASPFPLYFGQVMETLDVVRLQGQTVCLSFWAKQGANFSGLASGLNVQIITGTGINQSAATLVAGTWTGQQTLQLMSPVNYAAMQPTVTTNISSFMPTTAMQRYFFTAVVPVNAMQLGVLFSYTPVGTSGADDSISFQGLQLEVASTPTAFEHRDVQVETEICQRYAWVIPEPANGTLIADGGASAAVNVQVYYIATPVQMRTNPNVNVVTGGFKVAASGALATAAIAAGGTHVPNAITITSAVSQALGGNAYIAGGGANTGYILASADF